MTKRLFIGFVAVAALALLVLGCGSSGGSSSDSVTKAEFIQQGDAICKKAVKEKSAALEAAFAKQGEKPLGKAGEEDLVTVVALPPIEKMTAELANLDLPSEGAAGAEAVIAAYEKAVQEAKSDPGGILSGANEPFTTPKNQAAKYGFKNCAIT